MPLLFAPIKDIAMSTGTLECGAFTGKTLYRDRSHVVSFNTFGKLTNRVE